MKNLDKFKKTLEKSLILDHKEKELFAKIPDSYWETIFARNFNGDIKLAERILFNEFDSVEDVDIPKLEKEKLKIENLEKASDMFVDFVNNGEKVVFITDNDNDGSLSQAGIIEFLKALDVDHKEEIYVEYAQAIKGNKNRGFTVDLVDMFVKEKDMDKNEKFLIVTADNGINSREEQLKIQEKYPNAHIIVTDHHLPNPDEVIVENDKTLIFNPKYKPTPFFSKKNISGANTAIVLLKHIVKKLNINYDEKSVEFKNMDEIGKIANLLDYVDTDIGDKPLRNYIIEKSAKIGTLLNVNNSLNKIITGELPSSVIETLTSNIKDLDIEKVKEQVDNIKRQNIMAAKLLKIHHKHDEVSTDLSVNQFYELLAIELEQSNEEYEGINPNYIEQLRPLIYNLSFIDNKNAFQNQLNETMLKVFEEIRSSERALFEEIRKGKVMHAEKLDNSTILYPVDPDITKVFNRKFLGKAYNEENNGLLMIFDNIEKQRVSGSFRSLYRIQDILKGKSALEKALKINIDFQGHDKAAGFFITKTDGADVTPKIISEVNKFISGRIEELRKEEQTSEVTYVVSDLDSLSIIDRINRQVKGNLSNMASISPIIKFNNSTYLTDSKTSVQYSLQQLVKEKKYGYVSVKMNFDDDTIIIPTELLRKIVDNNFKDYIKISYMDDGVFMATNVIESPKVKNSVKVTRGNEEREDLLTYFKDRFLNNNHEVDLTYDMLRDIPYFKNNSFGDMEFSRFENLVIRIIESMDADVLAVVDTEGTGLGKAPKCLNLGALNFEVDKESGEKVALDKFENAYFKTLHGMRYLLNEGEQADLIELNKEQVESLSFEDRKLLLEKDVDGSFYMHNPKNVKKKNKFKQVLNNYKKIGEEVHVNRKIKGNVISYLINDTDFKLPQEIVALTGISNRMLNAAGKRTHVVDEEFTKKYDGKKVIFQAHNLPYDLGVIEANMPKLFDKMEQSILSDSAIFSRRMKLAYDKIKVASLPEIKTVYFYCSDYSDTSFIKFIEKAEADSKFTGIFPDRTGKNLLKIADGVVSIIDKESNNEYALSIKVNEIKDKMILGELPNTGIKYSVEQLSLHETVRNILLSKEAFNIKKVDIPNDLNHLSKEMNYFMENYHFDSTPSENFGHFLEYVGFENEEIYAAEESIVELAEKFLESNKEIQTKFADAWVYKKVLTLHDPEKGKITDDIVDILAYQTDLPKDKVKVVLKDAVDYKEKFNLDHTLVHEVHNNIVYDKEGLGDVMVESVLTLKRLADTNYNSYMHDSEYAVKLFTSNALKTTTQHIQRKMKDLALDSYSAKQARGYKRKIKSDFVDKVNETALDLVKFKLEIDILPQDTSVYGVPKKELTIKEIDDLSEKLTFVLKNEQLLHSLSKSKMSQKASEAIKLMLERNIPKCLEYKSEIMNSLEYVYFDRKDSEMKKITSMMFDVCLGHSIDIPDYGMSETDKAIFIGILDKYEEAFKKMNIPFNRLAGETFITGLNYGEPFTPEEVEIAKIQKYDENGLRDFDFLREVKIVRRNIMDWAFKNAPEIIYNTLDKGYEINIDLNNKSKRKFDNYVMKI